MGRWVFFPLFFNVITVIYLINIEGYVYFSYCELKLKLLKLIGRYASVFDSFETNQPVSLSHKK